MIRSSREEQVRAAIAGVEGLAVHSDGMLTQASVDKILDAVLSAAVDRTEAERLRTLIDRLLTLSDFTAAQQARIRREAGVYDD